MTSRERVLMAFAHQEPDRVPCWCGASPEFLDLACHRLNLPDTESLLVRLGDDFRRVTARYCGPDFQLSSEAESRTIMGVERHGMGYGQPLSHPLAGASLRQIHEYPWPDPAWLDVAHLREEARGYEGQYAMMGGDWSPFWHDAIDLLGMENLLLMMHDAPELVDAVLGHLADYYAAASQRIFEAAGSELDIFFMGNDLGGQTGPLVGPAQFERYLLPHLKRLINLGHEYGLAVQLHCCGGFEPLLPLLIEAELDAVHAIQPCCTGMDLPTLKATYGDRITFNGAIDSQRVLLEGTPDYVREQTREVLAIMAPGGGYVAGASHDYILPETPVENVVAMFDAIAEFGVY